jgi:hypothetical protein
LPSRKGVEDDAESELELVAEVVAGLQDVLGRHLDEVRVLIGAEPLHDRLGDVGGSVLEGHGGLLQGESVHVAIEQRVRMSVSTEVGAPQGSIIVVVSQRRRARRPPHSINPMAQW